MRASLIVIFLIPGLASAGPGMYQDRAEFLTETFQGAVPPPAVVWLTHDLRERATNILGHAPTSLRLRYWERNRRSAWIIDEIGKERPITIGVAIMAGRIETVRVLQFRESYGWEVRYPFFTKQFAGAGIGNDNKLDTAIDSISGATLSVNAVRRVAALALYLHEHTSRKIPQQARADP